MISEIKLEIGIETWVYEMFILFVGKWLNYTLKKEYINE